MSDRYSQLIEQLYPLKATLQNHRVYSELCDLYSLRIFMESHIFAVWDFMSLVKALQRKITCVTTPWLPPKDILSARLINDIVLAEETDEVSCGQFMSHFDLYLAGMREVGANTTPIENFIEQLRKEESVQHALETVTIPSSTKAFVLSTMKASLKPIHEVAATFLFGRENVIPSMFRRILQSLDHSSYNCKQLTLYLERHTHLDEDFHGPMGEQLLKNVCGNKEENWKQATTAAEEAILARIALWDGLLSHVLALKVALNNKSKELLDHTVVR